MRKLLIVSLLLNLLFFAGLCWAAARYGGLRALVQKLITPGVVLEYQRLESIFKNFPVEAGSIVFLGNSLTAGGQWSEWFGSSRIANRGIPGDHADGIRNRLDEALGPDPAAVFLMVGINDLAFHTPDTVLRKCERLLQALRQRAPRANVYLQSVLPVDDSRPGLPVHNGEIQALNAGLKKLAEKLELHWIDLYSRMADENGKLPADFTLDGVHLTGPAYRVWVDAIRPAVESELARLQ
ncbi:MAG: sialate O-acetylesterase [Saprospiraceae bacterium]|nr:MAG: sialate O-acetylesterase [Saprospiraceae bacterium]